MDVNNLTNVYNQNPTLQGSYTLQQYLDLFGGSSTGTPTPTPTPDPTTTPDPGIPSIINSNINQGGGGGGDRTPPGPTFSKNDNLGTSDYQGTGPGFFEGLKDTAGNIVDFAKSGGIFGNVLRGIFGKKKDYEKQTSIKTANKARDRIEAERKAVEQAKIDAQIARDFYAGHGRTDIATQPGGSDGMSGGQYSGGDSFSSANTYGGDGTMDDLGADNFAKGGVVNLKNGGSTDGSGEAALSAKVKELMDDGYEFGEAVKEAMKQGYMNGGRIKSYFKGGLVSLRGK